MVVTRSWIGHIRRKKSVHKNICIYITLKLLLRVNTTVPHREMPTPSRNTRMYGVFLNANLAVSINQYTHFRVFCLLAYIKKNLFAQEIKELC